MSAFSPRYLLNIILVSSLVGIAPMSMANTATSGANPIITEKDDVITVVANKPQFTIRLPANPTTGYLWSIKHYNDHFISLQKQRYVAGSGGRIGSGGYSLWSFKVKPAALKASHRFDITLIYGRPWEKQAAKQKVFHVVTKP